jgi:hypothetical protein
MWLEHSEFRRFCRPLRVSHFETPENRLIAVIEAVTRA